MQKKNQPKQQHQSEAEKRFSEWLEAKENKISDKKQKLVKAAEDAEKASIQAEKEKNEERAAAIANKNSNEKTEETTQEENTVEEVVNTLKKEFE